MIGVREQKKCPRTEELLNAILTSRIFRGEGGSAACEACLVESDSAGGPQVHHHHAPRTRTESQLTSRLTGNLTMDPMFWSVAFLAQLNENMTTTW
jgi:hypothetical protein